MTELAVELVSPAGEELRIEWDEAALAGLDPEAGGGELWRLAGELDWDEVESLRVLSGRLEDGRAVAIAALRPAGAAGHGEEAIAGAIVHDSGAEELTEVLLSTEYGPDSDVRRVGLELYPEEDAMPLRVAGDAASAAAEAEGEVRRLRVTLRLRAAGTRGAGVFDVLSRR